MKLNTISSFFLLAMALFGPAYCQSVGEDSETVIINSARVIAAAMPIVKHAIKKFLPDFAAPNPNATNFFDKLRHAVIHESDLSPVLVLWNNSQQTSESVARILISPISSSDVRTPQQVKEVDLHRDLDFAINCFLARSQSHPVTTACLDLAHLPNASATESQIRRHRHYLSLVKKACRRGKGNEDKAFCTDYFTELATDCFFSKFKSPFCKYIAKGPAVRNTPMKKYNGKLNDIYKKVVYNFRRTQVRVIECFHYFRNRKIESCRGITWNATAPDTARDLAIFDFYQRLLKLEESSTNATIEERQEVANQTVTGK